MMQFAERPTSRLFESDVLVAHEFSRQSQQSRWPEERLMMAVLGDALFCFQKYHLARDREGQKSFADAEAWMFDDNDQWPFSFTNICGTLGLSPTYLRRQMNDWKAHHLRQAPRSRATLKLWRCA